MADPISGAIQNPVQQQPQSRVQRETSVEQEREPRQQQRAEAARENEQPEPRRADPTERVGTQIDTQV